VTIFEDPLTRQRPEGQAVIVRRVGRPDPDLGQRCVVHFIEDSPDQVVERWVTVREVRS
jgi:hypothetical protein